MTPEKSASTCVQQRYADAYATAASLLTLGKFLRIGSVILSWSLVALDLMLFFMKAGGDLEFYARLGTLALKIGVFGYVAGLLIVAMAKHMRVTTDIAIAVSCTVSDDEKRAMVHA